MQALLRKREEKLRAKAETKRKRTEVNAEEKEIMQKVKGRKKQAKRERLRETDAFD